LRKLNLIWDYFIICSGEVTLQVEAIYEEVVKKAKEEAIEIHHVEQDREFRWVLVDFFDVALHIFSEDMRSFYDLEHLWKEAKRVSLKKILSKYKINMG